MRLDREVAQVLHLSDIHFRAKDQLEIQRRLTSIAKALRDASLGCDVLLITGDIAFSGVTNEYEAFRPLLDELILQVECPPENILICPGNHDVDRSLVNKFSETGYRQLLKKPTDADEVWRNDEQRIDATARMKAFAAFAAAYPKDLTLECADGTTVGLNGLNSAWRSAGDEDKGNLFLSLLQIEESAAKSVADVRLVAMHHPLAWLNESEQDVITTAIVNNYDILCHGHRHVSDTYARLSPIGGVVISAAKAVFDPEYPNGFSHIAIHPTRREVEFRYFAYYPNQQSFRVDTEHDNAGKVLHRLNPKRDKATSLSVATARQIRQRIETRKMQVAQALSGLAPKLSEYLSLADVLPRLRQIDATKKSYRPIAPESLLSDKQRRKWLISGFGLSGRSWILQYLSESALRLAMSPIMVNGDQLSAARNDKQLVAIIANAAGLSSNKLKALLRAGCVILVDDVPEPLAAQLKDLFDEVLQDHPAARVIFATEPRLSTTALVKDRAEEMSGWFVADVAPIALSSISKLTTKLTERGMVSLRPSDVRSFVMECFQSELPRLPWVVMMFLELTLEDPAALVGSTLPELTRKLVDLRLSPHGDRTRRPEQATSPVIRRRYLALLARNMLSSRRASLGKVAFAEMIRADLAASALSLAPEAVLASLRMTGLIVEDGDAVGFAFPVFLDYFIAESLIEGDLKPWLDMSAVDAAALGGALSFYLAKRSVDAEAIVSRTFELAEGIVGVNAVRSIELTDYVSQALGIEPGELDKIDPARAVDELDAQADNVEHESRGRHKRRFEAVIETSAIDRLLAALRAGVLELRAAAFLDSRQKIVFADRAITLTTSLIHQMITDPKFEAALSSVLSERGGRVPERLHSVLVGVLVLAGSAVLTQAGTGFHLRATLDELLRKETDAFRSLVILCWLSGLCRDSVERPVKDFIEKRPSYQILAVAELWFLAEYVFHSALEGRRDQVRRRGVELLVEERARRRQKNRATRREMIAKQVAVDTLKAADNVIAETDRREKS